MAMEIVISVILLLLGIAVLIVIHVCVVGRAFRGDSSSFDFGQGRATRAAAMDPEDVKNLPWFNHNGSGSAAGNVECAVCLDIFRAGEKCRILPVCNHCFHAECIDSWLMKTAACPVCRALVRSGQEQDDHRQSGRVELV